jgi:hypothetical protein
MFKPADPPSFGYNNNNLFDEDGKSQIFFSSHLPLPPCQAQ